MSAVQPFLSRTGRHLASFLGAPDVPVRQARLIGSFLSRAQHVVTFAPNPNFNNTAPSTPTLTAAPASFVSTFAPAVLHFGISAQPASFATTFNPARLIKSWSPMPAAKATFVTTFNAATLFHGTGKLMTAEKATYASTFYDVNLVIGTAGGTGVNVRLRLMKTKK